MTMPAVRRPRGKLWAVLAGLIALPVLALGLYTLAALGWSYSDGERAGVLQKFSHKGWFCKTYEGELAMYVVPGVAPTIWEFTVRDPAVVDRLNAALGKRVSLHYEEHRGLPTTCLGQTAYFVDGVRIVE
jgi:hypothetical protein